MTEEKWYNSALFSYGGCGIGFASGFLALCFGLGYCVNSTHKNRIEIDEIEQIVNPLEFQRLKTIERIVDKLGEQEVTIEKLDAFFEKYNLRSQ